MWICLWAVLRNAGVNIMVLALMGRLSRISMLHVLKKRVFDSLQGACRVAGVVEQFMTPLISRERGGVAIPQSNVNYSRSGSANPVVSLMRGCFDLSLCLWTTGFSFVFERPGRSLRRNHFACLARLFEANMPNRLFVRQ